MATLNPQQRQQYKAAMERDVSLFAQICLKETVSDSIPPIHKRIYAAAEDPNIPKLLAALPRRHGKSTILGQIKPLHYALHAKKPEIIVITSKTQSHASRLLNWIKSKLETDAIKYWYGDFGEATALVWTKSEIVLKNNVMIIALGMGQQIRGIKHLDARIGLLVCDDMEDKENTKTLESMEANLDWMIAEAEYAVDHRYGKILVIGTPIRDGCLIYQLRDSPDYHTIWEPAIQDMDRKIVLWPERESFEALMKDRAAKKAIGRLAKWSREMQLEIVPSGDQLFQPDDINPFRWTGTYRMVPGKPYGLIEMGERKIPVNVFMGVDPASSISERADYSVIMVIGVCSKGHIYIIDYFRDRVQPLALSEKILEYGEKYQPIRASVESVQFQEMLRQTVYEEMRKRHARGGHWISGLDEKVLPRRDKTSRIEALQPWFARHMVHLREGRHEELYRELTSFPRVQHDDTLDGLELAMKRMRPCGEDEYKGDKMPVREQDRMVERIDWMTGFREPAGYWK